MDGFNKDENSNLDNTGLNNYFNRDNSDNGTVSNEIPQAGNVENVSAQDETVNTGVRTDTEVQQLQDIKQPKDMQQPEAGQQQGYQQGQPQQVRPQQAQPPYARPQQTIPFSGSQQPKNQTYYTENVKKTKQRKIGAGHLILVSVLSSLLGAGVMLAAAVYVAPLIRPGADKLLGTSASASETSVGDNGIYKKVEITQSSSPVEAIAEKVGPSIVGIQITVPARSNFGFFFDLEQNGVGYGSGIIIRKDGYILTNNHVIENAVTSQMSNKLIDGAKIEVVLPGDKNKLYEAQIVGRDSKTDIAVLKINLENLPAAEFGDSDEVKIGQLAVAIGNPGGMDYMGSVTAGIISGINRSIVMDNGQELELIQTDAAINPGNSGGALVNSQGQVIGVNTIKIAATDVEGIGFAIPINQANIIAESLIEHKYVKDRPYIGVVIDNTFTKEDADKLKVPYGLLVWEVQPLSAAYKAGIHTGDIIIKFDGKSITEFKDLEDQKNTHKPGDKVMIEVYRDGEMLTLEMILGEEKNID
jgi:serine protease Do